MEITLKIELLHLPTTELGMKLKGIFFAIQDTIFLLHILTFSMKLILIFFSHSKYLEYILQNFICKIDKLSSTEMITSSFIKIRGGSRTAATSKMEHFVIIVNGWKPLTIITKSSIFDVAAVLDPPLKIVNRDKILMLEINQDY